MKVDAQLKDTAVAGIEARAAECERRGYDGLWSAETNHDPFLPVVLACARTDRIEVGTAVALAFARNPMSMAYTAHDLQVLSQGRFRLGIGSQVKAHIERRFSMPWARPAARMRDFICALRAIWASWNDGAALDYDGLFYRHTLMPPLFRPEPSPWGAPGIYLAAVGDQMVRVAGELADGLIVHSFSSVRSLRERTIVTLGTALGEAARARTDVQVSLPLLVATGVDPRARQLARDRVRGQIAFYASTPAYRWILDLHGWSELGERLTALSRDNARDSQAAMTALIDDDMLHEFAVVGEPGQVGRAINDRFAGLVDRVSLYMPYRIDPAVVAEIATDVRSGRLGANN